MFIIDALIANFDRHGSNWGFIKKDNQYRLSPVFDNRSGLFPQLNTDEKIEAVLRNQEEIDMRIYKFPTSQVKYKGKKNSYYEIISEKRKEFYKTILKQRKTMIGQIQRYGKRQTLLLELRLVWIK